MSRTLALTNPAMKGEDVKHAQGQLNKYLGDRAPHLNVDGVFGQVSANNSRLAKYYLGYPRGQVKSTYGATLERYLTGKHKPSHGFRVRARRRHRRGGGVGRLRNLVVAHARWGVRNAGSIHYQQSRPMDGLYRVHKLPLYIDCSGFATLCYKWAGAPDPNGLGYNGQGYTGSLLNHMREIDRSQLRPGDLIVFGYFPGEHVVIYIGSNQCVSHGTEGDPTIYTVDVMNNYFPGPTHYLKLKAWWGH